MAFSNDFNKESKWRFFLLKTFIGNLEGVMKLSICMMVKNEEKNLERCLNSLDNLRKSVDSELIIIDTGSSDSTVEISKKYTDKVFFHEWNDNFSEMRNISISYANGDWIFIIDADEELVEDIALINMLKMKNTKFSVIALILRNVLSSNGKFGGDLVTTRLFKNDGFFHYDGSVHNMPIFKGEGVRINTLLYHYGYISDDFDLMEKKFERTSKLLIAELEKDPDNIYYTYQLGSTYDMHKDNDLSETYFIRAYEMAKNKNELRKYLYIYGALSKVLLTMKKYNRTIEIASEGLMIDSDYLDLLFFAGTAYLFQENFEKGTNLLEDYLVKKANFMDLKISLNTSIQMYTSGGEEEARQNLVKAYFRSDNYNALIPHAQWLLENMIIESTEYGSIVSYLIHAYYKLGEIKSIIYLYESLGKHRWTFLDDLLYLNLKSQNWNEHLSVIKELSGLQSPFGMLLKAFLSGVNLGTLDDINKCLELGYSEALKVMIDENMDISNVLTKLSESKIMEVFSNLNEKYCDFESNISLYINEHKSRIDIKSLNMLRIARKYLGLKNFNDSKYMLEYFESGINFLSRKYTAEYVSDMQGNGYLNSEEQLLSLLYWSKLNNEKINSETIEQAVSYFSDWRNHIYKWYDKLLNTSNLVEDEMKDLLVVLKSNIIEQANSGERSEVLHLIDEYLRYQPQDIEMILLKSDIMVEKTKNH